MYPRCTVKCCKPMTVRSQLRNHCRRRRKGSLIETFGTDAEYDRRRSIRDSLRHPLQYFDTLTPRCCGFAASRLCVNLSLQHRDMAEEVSESSKPVAVEAASFPRGLHN